MEVHVERMKKTAMHFTPELRRRRRADYSYTGD